MAFRAEDQLGGLKTELVRVSTDLLALEDDDLSKKESTLSKTHFDVCLKLKLQDRAATPSTTPLSTPSSALSPAPTGEGSGVRLPKLDVPPFDGDLVHWASFWEQFTISMHGRKDLTDSEKLAYLQNAVKDGSAKHVVEGLSRTGEHYKEAVDTLRKRYDRPRLIHQAHVCAILCAPALKTGSRKELRRLHDTLVQHLRGTDEGCMCLYQDPWQVRRLHPRWPLDSSRCYVWNSWSSSSSFRCRR